jgi:N-acyl-D-aspartate/D-glutamate deacylase
MSRLLIANGTVVDGSGAPRRFADVLVEDGRITWIGTESSVTAEQTVDALGLVVAPGFIDVHTHFDAQVLWDPALSPSAAHGVTTVLAGNCGFALAPSSGENIDYLQRMMARVEGIPLESIRAGIDWNWKTVPEYLDRIAGNVGPNMGFLAGHSAIRRDAMGDRAAREPATDADVRAMEQLLREILDAGALGFSSSLAVVHRDGDGLPVPSRLATSDELLRLSAVVADSSAVAIQMTSPGAVDGFTPDEVELMVGMSRASERALNWNMLTVRGRTPSFTDRQIAASYEADRAGARVYALMLPHSQRLRFTLKSGVILANLPGWDRVFALPHDERIAALRDHETRRRLREGSRSGEGYVGAVGRSIVRMELADTLDGANQRFVGWSVGAIAEELGTTPVDALIDLALTDGLEAGFRSPRSEHEDELWEERRRAWNDPFVVVGASDAGAHLDMMCGSVYTTSLLGEGVRDRKLLSLEQAVSLLSREPAQLYGLRGRGELQEGAAADVVIFDPAEVRPGPERLEHDLPGGCPRVVAPAEGIHHVFVNGVAVIEHGTPTAARPGTLLRAGRDAAA